MFWLFCDIKQQLKEIINFHAFLIWKWRPVWVNNSDLKYLTFLFKMSFYYSMVY